MISENGYMPPKTPVHFPRTDEFSRLFKENKDGRYTIFNYAWLASFKADAIRATAGEPDGLIRGGLIARHILQNMPVIIEPQDLFAAFGLVPRTMAEQDKASRNLWNLPSCYGNYIHIAPDYETLLKKGIKGLLNDINEKQQNKGEV